VGAKPVIGITGPDRGGFIAWRMAALAVWRQGGIPVRISPSRPADANRLQGLIIGGGADVDPLHYAEEHPDEKAAAQPPDAQERTGVLDWVIGLALGLSRLLFANISKHGYDPGRDDMEKRLLLHALDRDLPTLGICRGAQLMNVVLGGTLHRDLAHFYTEDTGHVRSILPRKQVDVAPDSQLCRILRTESCAVNALHNQCVRDLGQGVAVSARERSGIVQAIERPEQTFFVGVQWHPEYMPQHATQQRLFRELLNCALG